MFLLVQFVVQSDLRILKIHTARCVDAYLRKPKISHIKLQPKKHEKPRPPGGKGCSCGATYVRM